MTPMIKAAKYLVLPQSVKDGPLTVPALKRGKRLWLLQQMQRAETGELKRPRERKQPLKQTRFNAVSSSEEEEISFHH